MLNITPYHLTDAVPTALFGIFALWAAILATSDSTMVPLTAQLDETGFKIAECKPNVSKLIPEIKVPSNVVFDTRPPNHT